MSLTIDDIREDNWEWIFTDHFGICGICGEYFADDDDIHIDHIVPRKMARGRVDDLSNLQPAHAACNQRKGCKPYYSESMDACELHDSFCTTAHWRHYNDDGEHVEIVKCLENDGSSQWVVTIS